ncbi:MAG: NADH:flavin oxidoreductase/NADH oxidase [Bacteroidales bacterium]
MSRLYSPLEIRNVRFKNRFVMSPMCQYSAIDGMATDWHFVHYGTRATGGVGLIIQEATAVLPEGRISPADLGLWDDKQIPPLQHICSFLKKEGCVAGIQLAHAGRKASTGIPWEEGDRPLSEAQGGWLPVAPSPIPFDTGYPVPKELTVQEIAAIQDAFATAALRALKAGFKVLEIHAAHGYLIHEFLSPVSNHRTDQYGGEFDNRIRFLMETVEKVRKVWPAELPLFVRISATDYVDGGWDITQSIRLSSLLRDKQVDLIDVSSGGLVPYAKIPVDFGYQLEFAREIRQQAAIMTGAVGMITTPEQAESILVNKVANLVFLGRELLRDPYFALHAAPKVHAETEWPPQYARAKK